MKLLILIVVLALLAVVGADIFLSQRGWAQEKALSALVKDVYYCPMHPNYTSDKPGSCPICGMDLVKKRLAPVPSPAREGAKYKERQVRFYRNPMDSSVTSPVPMKDSMGMDYIPVYAEAEASVSRQEVGSVEVSSQKQQLIGIKKDMVQTRHLSLSIQTIGKVAYDPELYVAQEGYVQAVKAAAASATATGEKGELAAVHEQAANFLTSLERKLILSGMTREEIAELKVRGSPEEGLYLPSSSGKVWVYLTVYANELGQVQPGQLVLVRADAYPGETFQGKVVGVTPVLDPVTRSVRVRAEVNDPNGKLKPEMFLSALLEVDLGERLSVPVSAVLETGLRKIVFVVKDNTFSPREVALGVKAGDYYAVVSGLVPGEEVVTSGNFLIDAESRLKGAL